MTILQNNAFNKKHIVRAFSRAAQHYDQTAVHAHEIGQRMLERFEVIRLHPTRILDLGAGTGKTTCLLAKHFSHAQLIATDITATMLNHAKRKTHWFSKQRFICADAELLPFPDHTFDLIFSNLMLPWCSQLDITLREIYRVLSPAGLFMFSTLGLDTLKTLRVCWEQIDADYPHIHTFQDIHHIGNSLMQAHFTDPVLDTEILTLTYTNTQSLMRDLKMRGEQNLSQNRRKTWTGKQRMQQFISMHDKWRNPQGLLTANYEVIYGHAWKLQKSTPKTVSISIKNIKRQ